MTVQQSISAVLPFATKPLARVATSETEFVLLTATHTYATDRRSIARSAHGENPPAISAPILITAAEAARVAKMSGLITSVVVEESRATFSTMAESVSVHLSHTRDDVERWHTKLTALLESQETEPCEQQTPFSFTKAQLSQLAKIKLPRDRAEEAHRLIMVRTKPHTIRVTFSDHFMAAFACGVPQNERSAA